MIYQLTPEDFAQLWSATVMYSALTAILAYFVCDLIHSLIHRYFDWRRDRKGQYCANCFCPHCEEKHPKHHWSYTASVYPDDIEKEGA